MKIAVLSLLRLGDVLMQKPLFEELRRRHPQARIVAVVNGAAKLAAQAIDVVDEWIVFDREGLQKRVGTAEIPILAPVREVDAFIARLIAMDFDLLINLTHNRLSAHLAGAIACPKKLGLVAEGRRFRALENRWQRHFNDRFGWKGATPFHYTELLAGSFGLTIAPERARARGNRVILQPLTSDSKKNWSLSNWRKLANALHRELPGHEITILGAPFERDALRTWFDSDELTIAGIGEARRLMSSAALVISGCTAIKHLAVGEGAPVLELALGSAEPRLTGAYQIGASILASGVACAPCPPSSTCRKLSHECGEALDAEAVAKAAIALVTNGPANGLGKARVIGGEWTTGDFADAFDKNAWRIFLDGAEKQATSLSARFLARAKADGVDAREFLEIIELEQRTLEGIVASIGGALKSVAAQCVAGELDPAAIAGLRRQLSGLAPVTARLRAHAQELDESGRLPFSHPLAFFGHVRRAVEELAARVEIRGRGLNLIRETNLGQGGPDERRARNVSEHGPEAT